LERTKLTPTKKYGLIAGPIFFLLILSLPEMSPITPDAQKVLAVTTWMLIWWVTEATNLAVTALLPVVLFPLTGVMPVAQAAASYGNRIIFLFMGGFLIALALEKWNLHLRIALWIIRATGATADGIIFGFMSATALLSMWISNTATTVMMLPIATIVIDLLQLNSGLPKERLKNFALSMMLAVAYSANIGGMATLIGTPPNIIHKNFMEKLYGYEINFLDWLMVGFPFAVILLLIMFVVLVKVFYPHRLGKLENPKKVIEDKLQELGPMKTPERLVMTIFIMTALLWMFGKQIQALEFVKTHHIDIHDSVIAMMSGVLMFVIPSGSKKANYLLSWTDTKELPWGILMLFGGGLSVATALKNVGLIQLIGDSIADNTGWSILIITGILVLIMLFMTEVMSNLALTSIFVPVVAGIAVSLGENPLLITIGVTMASSCAFMLPMATPPNAIVFASGHIKVFQMVRIGFWLNLLSILLVILFIQFIIPHIFEIELGVIPDWAIEK